MAGVNLFLRLLAPLGRQARELGRRRRGGLGRRLSAVLNADDVIAVPRFDKFFGSLSFLQRECGGFKSRVHSALAEPAQVTSFSLTASVIAEFTGDLLEVLAILHAFEQPLGLLFLLIRVGSRMLGQILLLLVIGKFVLLFE